MGEVITYEEPRYSMVRLDSGERVLLSVAQDGIVLYRMRLGGFLPGSRIGSWTPGQIHDFVDRFGFNDPGVSPFRSTVEFIAGFSNIDELLRHIVAD
jgi:hypothetical protein